MPGMHGWVHVNRAIQECDVLLNIGGRFDDRVTGKVSTFAPHAEVIHVDIDPSEIGKNVKTQCRSWAMPARARRRCSRRCPRATAPSGSPTSGDAGQASGQAAYLKRPDTPALMPHDVYDGLNRAFRERGNCKVVTDVGQHQMWAAQLIDWLNPRSHITSGGSGTMGFSVPAALGAAVACPDETIWVICGDGGFQMTNQELATIKQEGIKNVKVAIINNGYLGMVRQWQELFENAATAAPRSPAPTSRCSPRPTASRRRRGDDRAGRGGDREGVGPRRFRGHRLPRRARGERLPDRPAGPEHRRHADDRGAEPVAPVCASGDGCARHSDPPDSKVGIRWAFTRR
jgi:thiamine pyrophosphate-dependent acetolactate synthase large subunit-like protein